MPVKRFFQPFVEIPFVQNTDSPIESLLELLNDDLPGNLSDLPPSRCT
ncbi:hypothetical protein PAE9249_02498 [Paenibacillus sp. CECT 9249]|nr:hypothetical protein PAE9249_02498 [Paenibacillus sp. CECT 9249]